MVCRLINPVDRPKTRKLEGVIWATVQTEPGIMLSQNSGIRRARVGKVAISCYRTKCYNYPATIILNTYCSCPNLILSYLILSYPSDSRR